MSNKRPAATVLPDPFGDHLPHPFRRRVHALGGVFDIQSNSTRLLRLVDLAYFGLPQHRLSTETPRFRLTLHLTAGERSTFSAEPPEVRTLGGAGLLSGIVDPQCFAVVCPDMRRGLVAFSRELLRYPYHARYELLEFAVFTLASRAQGLAPFHAGCVGLNGTGVLLIGDSGAGKSTLALQCMLRGLDVLAEDAVFVAPRTLRATGVANFLHLHEDSLRFISDSSIVTDVRKSPVIRRRSGVEKFEVDLRRKAYRVAQTPLKIARIVFVSHKPASGGEVLTPLSDRQSRARLAASQPYARHLSVWPAVEWNLSQVQAFELRRRRHPGEAAEALRGLVETGTKPR